ncbi:MAG: hypothetical protein Q8R76_11560 [Candidatus Omnitrophota bacterium]|nr:hypothetical protein [Candidatus Omnitrophota bacterium]
MIFPKLKKIGHLTRYFALIGIIAFLLFWVGISSKLSLIVIGPVIYLAYWIKSFISSSLFKIPASERINDFVFLLPLVIVYFAFVGFQLKQLWNEKGAVRFLSLIALSVFLVFVHFTAWKNLTAFYLLNP